MTSRERIRTAAVKAGWSIISDQRIPRNRMVLTCHPWVTGHRLVVWFGADDWVVLGALHEFGGGQCARLDPSEVLQHIKYWDAP